MQEPGKSVFNKTEKMALKHLIVYSNSHMCN